MGCGPKNDDMMVWVRVTVSHMLRSTSRMKKSDLGFVGDCTKEGWWVLQADDVTFKAQKFLKEWPDTARRNEEDTCPTKW